MVQDVKYCSDSDTSKCFYRKANYPVTAICEHFGSCEYKRPRETNANAFVFTTTTETKEQVKKQCDCVVKTTEVKGMCIIYPRGDCPVHGKLN